MGEGRDGSRVLNRRSQRTVGTAGVSELQTWLLDVEGQSRGAYYVEVERVGD